VATPAKARRLQVLLTEGSSLSSREAVLALGLAGHDIEVCDPDPKRVHRSPRFGRDPDAYLAFVLDVLQRGGHDVLLPVHEQVLLFAKVRDAIPPSVGLAVSSFTAVSTLLSKISFARILTELGLPAPATRVVRSRAKLEESRPLQRRSPPSWPSSP